MKKAEDLVSARSNKRVRPEQLNVTAMPSQATSDLGEEAGMEVYSRLLRKSPNLKRLVKELRLNFLQNYRIDSVILVLLVLIKYLFRSETDQENAHKFMESKFPEEMDLFTAFKSWLQTRCEAHTLERRAYGKRKSNEQEALVPTSASSSRSDSPQSVVGQILSIDFSKSIIYWLYSKKVLYDVSEQHLPDPLHRMHAIFRSLDDSVSLALDPTQVDQLFDALNISKLEEQSPEKFAEDLLIEMPHSIQQKFEFITVVIEKCQTPGCRSVPDIKNPKLHRIHKVSNPYLTNDGMWNLVKLIKLQGVYKKPSNTLCHECNKNIQKTKKMLFVTPHKHLLMKFPSNFNVQTLQLENHISVAGNTFQVTGLVQETVPRTYSFWLRNGDRFQQIVGGHLKDTPFPQMVENLTMVMLSKVSAS